LPRCLLGLLAPASFRDGQTFSSHPLESVDAESSYLQKFGTFDQPATIRLLNELGIIIANEESSDRRVRGGSLLGTSGSCEVSFKPVVPGVSIGGHANTILVEVNASELRQPSFYFAE
jgi:hypothetical protein